MLLLMPLVTLWHCAASLLSQVAGTVYQPRHLKSKHNVPGRLVKEVHEQDGRIQSSSPRIGTQVHPSGTMASGTMPVGCQAGSLVWLILDVNIFMEVIVRKVILDRNGKVLKYNVWLDAGCLVEANEDQLVQPFKVGSCVSVTALGQVHTAQ